MWLDCDPGHDDALAICMALYHPRINLLGISTVHGNQTVHKTAVNALNFLHTMGADLKIPVYKGQEHPVVRPGLTCGEIHGESGLDGFTFPTPRGQIKAEKGVVSMAEAILKNEKPVVLCVTGCMTNVALMFSLYPETKAKISKLTFMGGAIGLGNTGPVAEWNIQIDPEAAHMVLESGVDIWMVPLEVTHTALVTKEVLGEIQQLESGFGDMLVKLMLFFAKTYKEVFDFDDPPLHDPCAVLVAVHPELFTHKFTRVDIELHSTLGAGQTVVDVFNLQKKKLNVHVCTHMDVKAFWTHMLSAIREANTHSPLPKVH
eukprot:GDKI01011830.1.p1 GENE.GDKI01011830.1~~GDKI01011830.1.p1  ORF type:complete len:368 (-),score=104.58 GDKI01011830.1:189-1139(-)